MINFFRRIRQRFLEHNKFRKYLLYAIGEIALVMIGILLALQINNWNEDRKDRAAEQELLTQLRSEFQSNLIQLDEKIEMRSRMLNASLKLLDYIDHPEQRNVDSVLTYLGYTMLGPTFDPIVNDISASGRLTLLQDYRLKEKLSLWTSEIIQVTEEEQDWVKYRSENHHTLLAEYGLLRSLINRYMETNIIGDFHLDKDVKLQLELGQTESNIDVFSILDDIQFESHIAYCASNSNLTNSQSLSLRKRIVEIIELIEQGINHD